jgi:hypothetical protein
VFSLAPDSTLTTPKRTLIGEFEDSVVVSNTITTKTISGADSHLSERILRACDGETPLNEIPRPDATDAQIVATAEKLLGAGLVYRTDQLSTLDCAERHHSLLESLLLSLSVESRDDFASKIESGTVALRGDQSVIDEFEFGLDAIDWTRADYPESPDVTVFLETPTVASRDAVNRDWLGSESVLLRLALDGTTVEVGPVLTPSSDACLACLTTREEMNGTGQQIAYEWARGGRTTEIEFLEGLVVRFVLQTVLKQIQSRFVGTIVSVDLATLECNPSRLLGVPGCEACNANY